MQPAGFVLRCLVEQPVEFGRWWGDVPSRGGHGLALPAFGGVRLEGREDGLGGFRPLRVQRHLGAALEQSAPTSPASLWDLGVQEGGSDAHAPLPDLGDTEKGSDPRAPNLSEELMGVNQSSRPRDRSWLLPKALFRLSVLTLHPLAPLSTDMWPEERNPTWTEGMRGGNPKPREYVGTKVSEQEGGPAVAATPTLTYQSPLSHLQRHFPKHLSHLFTGQQWSQNAHPTPFTTPPRPGTA